jgi:hypothetical protein
MLQFHKGTREDYIKALEERYKTAEDSETKSQLRKAISHVKNFRYGMFEPDQEHFINIVDKFKK